MCNKQELHQLKIHIPYHLTKLFNVMKISIQFGFMKTWNLMDKKIVEPENEYKGLWYKTLHPQCICHF